MLRNPADVKDAEFVASKSPAWNSMMRTTCVATMLSGGHAHNALPQRADANVNCRIFPGVPAEQVRTVLSAAINDPEVTITQIFVLADAASEADPGAVAVPAASRHSVRSCKRARD
jgi:acetylornithine deacetylase/succinyl-diaminopimelate desuccinylase-like protein